MHTRTPKRYVSFNLSAHPHSREDLVCSCKGRRRAHHSEISHIGSATGAYPHSKEVRRLNPNVVHARTLEDLVCSCKGTRRAHHSEISHIGIATGAYPHSKEVRLLNPYVVHARTLEDLVCSCKDKRRAHHSELAKEGITTSGSPHSKGTRLLVVLLHCDQDTRFGGIYGAIKAFWRYIWRHLSRKSKCALQSSCATFGGIFRVKQAFLSFF